MTNVVSVSAVFPCYNDETTIGGLVDDVYEALAPLVADVEVIVVNDGSADDSRDVLDRLAKERDWLKVIHHETNGGYGKALLSGFAAAQHEWIFYTDGDAQYDASEAALLVPLATDNIDVVQGYKIGRGTAS
jgi:glycosyltransferase involved in cell wall biosynthesis